MTIQLQLKPEIEARLIAEATAKGVSVEVYLESLIEDSLTSKEKQLVSP
jgi:predicted HicB family RNase H-like nuclease